MAAPRVGLSLGVAPEHASPADEQHYPPAAGFPIPDVTHKEEAEEDRECDTSSIGADEAGSGAVHGGGHGGATRLAGLRYTVTEVPPWHVCIILGFQHYLTMLGSTVVIPALLVPAMGGTAQDHARVVQTIFFVSGINTLIQTTIGDRLPIVQGGSFSFLKPAFSIIAIVKATMTFDTEHDRFLYTMRVLQGSIVGSSFLIMAIGYTGAMGALLRFLSPVVVAPTVCMVGLALYGVGFSGVAQCLEQGLMAIVAVILFSQVLKRVELPLPRGMLSRPPSPSLQGPLLAPGTPRSATAAALGGAATALAAAVKAGAGGGGRRSGVRIFELFPLLWSILLCWGIAGILTASGVYDNASSARQASCRTDNMDALHSSPWVYVPYPLQWGMPIFKPAFVITMMAGALAAMIESTGDYYACARMCGAPVPPPYIISRGIGAEGLGILMSGMFGTGNGTTSYAENIGAIGLTGVGSRRVVQAGASIMLLLAVLGKFGGLFASLPFAIISGLFCCVFGIIASVGLSNLQFTDQNSSRNMLIVGFALYMALSVPSYFDTYTAQHGGAGPINTSNQQFNDIMNTLFSTPMCVALMLALLLDNVIAGTPEERGLTHWAPLTAQQRQQQQQGGGSGGGGAMDDDAEPDGLRRTPYGYEYDDTTDEEEEERSDPRNDPRIKAVYDLPYYLQLLNDRYILPYRKAVYWSYRRAKRAVRRWARRWFGGRRGGQARPLGSVLVAPAPSRHYSRPPLQHVPQSPTHRVPSSAALWGPSGAQPRPLRGGGGGGGGGGLGGSFKHTGPAGGDMGGPPPLPGTQSTPLPREWQ